MTAVAAFLFGSLRVLAAGLILLPAYLVGRCLTTRVTFRSGAERSFFATGLGLAVLGTSAFLLGMAGALRGGLLALGVLSVCLGFCREVAKEDAVRLRNLWRRRGSEPFAFVAAALAALLVAPVCLIGLYPPTGWDATMYHLTAAKLYASSHGVAFSPFLRCNWFPQFNELLYAICLLWFDDVTAQVLEVALFALCGLGLYAWGHRLSGRGAGALAACLWLTSPLAAANAAAAYVDNGVALFVLLGTYALHCGLSGEGRGWFALAGTFFGIAAGTKYTGLAAAGLALVVCLVIAIRRRRASEVVVFAALLSLAAAPWYARTWAATGDPVYPLLSLATGREAGPLTLQENSDLITQLRSRYGVPRSGGNLLRLPWLLSSAPERFSEEPVGAGAPLLPLIVLALFSPLTDRRLLVPLAILLGYVLYWFGTFQILRFVIAVLPLVLLLGSVTLAWALRRRGLARWASLAWLAAVAATIVAPGTAQARALGTVRQRGALPTSSAARGDYLRRQLTPYAAIEAMNSSRPEPWTAYGAGTEDMAYFAHGILIGDHFGPGRYSAFDAARRSGEGLFEFVRGFGADLFLIAHDRIIVDLPRDEFFRGHFRPIYESSSVQAFQLVAEATKLPPPLEDPPAVSQDFVAEPNPIPVCDGTAVGITTLSWRAPPEVEVEVRVGRPDGPLFTRAIGSGSATTGKWVSNRMVFFLTRTGPHVGAATIGEERLEVRLDVERCR